MLAAEHIQPLHAPVGQISTGKGRFYTGSCQQVVAKKPYFAPWLLAQTVNLTHPWCPRVKVASSWPFGFSTSRTAMLNALTWCHGKRCNTLMPKVKGLRALVAAGYHFLPLLPILPFFAIPTNPASSPVTCLSCASCSLLHVPLQHMWVCVCDE